MPNEQQRATKAARSKGELALVEIAEAIEHFVEHGDWTRIGKLMQAVGPSDSIIIRKIVERCLIGATFERTTKNEYGWKLKVDRDLGRKTHPLLKTCKKLATQHVSFRSAKVAEIFSIPDTNLSEYDLDSALLRIIKNAEKAGKSSEVLDELKLCRQRVFRLDRRNLYK